jgi:hypothetical protein
LWITDQQDSFCGQVFDSHILHCTT